MSAKYESNVLISASIKLTDVTEEVYRDILNYIEKKIAEPVKLPTADSSFTVKKNDISAGNGNVPEPAEIGQKNISEKSKAQIAEDLESLCIEYMGDPDRKAHYILMEMTADQFVSAHPEYTDLTVKGAGRYLSAILSKYPSVLPQPIKKSIRVDEANSIQFRSTKLYYIPRRRKLFRDAIHNIMDSRKITLKELSGMIGYSVDMITQWMNDTLPVSDIAKRRFLAVFGEHTLDGVEFVH